MKSPSFLLLSSYTSPWISSYIKMNLEARNVVEEVRWSSSNTWTGMPCPSSCSCLLGSATPSSPLAEDAHINPPLFSFLPLILHCEYSHIPKTTRKCLMVWQSSAGVLPSVFPKPKTETEKEYDRPSVDSQTTPASRHVPVSRKTRETSYMCVGLTGDSRRNKDAACSWTVDVKSTA
jgi:hypothetical protein